MHGRRSSAVAGDETERLRTQAQTMMNRLLRWATAGQADDNVAVSED